MKKFLHSITLFMSKILTALDQISQYLISDSDFTYIKSIGKGGYGEVFLARHEPTKREVALKKLNFNSVESSQFLYYAREVLTLANCNNPFLVKFLGFSKKPPFLIATEYVPSGSLYDALHHMPGSPVLTPTDKTIIAMGIANGMISLHDQNIVHRDLKSMNVLLNEKKQPVICDFGISRTVSDNTSVTSSIGTPHWMAPEIFQFNNYTIKVDVYAFAILFWELLTEGVPFFNVPPLQVCINVIQGKRPAIPTCADKSIKEFLARAWSPDPDERPTFREILALFKEKFVYFPGTDLSAIDKFMEENPVDNLPVIVQKSKSEEYEVDEGKLTRRMEDWVNPYHNTELQFFDSKKFEEYEMFDMSNMFIKDLIDVSNKMNFSSTENIFLIEDFPELAHTHDSMFEFCGDEDAYVHDFAKALKAFSSTSPQYFKDVSLELESKNAKIQYQVLHAISKYMDKVPENIIPLKDTGFFDNMVDCLRGYVEVFRACMRQNENWINDYVPKLFDMVNSETIHQVFPLLEKAVRLNNEEMLLKFIQYHRLFSLQTQYYELLSEGCMNSPKLSKALFKRIKHDINSIENKKIIGICYKTLSAFVSNLKKLNLKYFLKHLNEPLHSGYVIDFFASLPKIPCSKRIIESLLEASKTNKKAVDIICSVGYEKPYCEIILSDLTWMSSIPAEDALSILICIYSCQKYKRKISKLNEVPQLFLRVLNEAKDYTIKKMIKFIITFDIDKQFISKLEELNFIRIAMEKSFSRYSGYLLKYGIILIDCLARVGFSNQYKSFLPYIYGILFYGDNLSNSCLEILYLLSEHESIRKELNNMKLSLNLQFIPFDEKHSEIRNKLIELLSK